MVEKLLGNGNVWRTLFVSLFTANLTGFLGWLMFGMDSVKHSEIDQILTTRAPYVYDKQRIQDHLDDHERRLEIMERWITEHDRKDSGR